MGRRDWFRLGLGALVLALVPRRALAVVLPDADRERVTRGLMRYWSRERRGINLLKPQVRSGVDATDDWQDTNAAAYNSALPVVVRTNLGALEKTEMFIAIAAMRAGPAFARAILGEID